MKNLHLNPQALKPFMVGIPLEIAKGHVRTVKVSIPKLNKLGSEPIVGRALLYLEMSLFVCRPRLLFVPLFCFICEVMFSLYVSPFPFGVFLRLTSKLAKIDYIELELREPVHVVQKEDVTNLLAGKGGLENLEAELEAEYDSEEEDGTPQKERKKELNRLEKIRKKEEKKEATIEKRTMKLMEKQMDQKLKTGGESKTDKSEGKQKEKKDMGFVDKIVDGIRAEIGKSLCRSLRRIYPG